MCSAESNSATNASDGVDWVVGTMVWTLFDYYGEPPVGGPEVSSTYGQYDLCGFPKAAAFWYRVQVSFQWKNPDFLSRNPDFLSRNLDFLFKNVDI